MKSKLISLFLTACILFMMPMTVSAQDFSYDHVGNISVTLIDPKGNTPITGAELSLYYVATVSLNGENNLSYTFTDTFENCGFALDDPALTAKLEEFVKEQSVYAEKRLTDSHGKITFEDLPLGLYFVQQTNDVEGYVPCTSFLVTVPNQSDESYIYDINASPKTEVARLTDITIRKVWNTDSINTISDSVTVQLIRDRVVVKTAKLSDQNDWQVTYTGMPESDAYSITEVDVPKGFTATYSQRGYVFTVTNTASLINTGQLIWPVPVLAIAGLLLLALGCVAMKKRGETRKRSAVCLIVLGICCLIASVGLIAYNRMEEENARNASQDMLQDIRESMTDSTNEESNSGGSSEDVMNAPEMPVTKIKGYDCIGVLSIPVIELELPVLTDWNYTKLRVAPCIYFGSYYEKDFVIAAHNYQSHFGRLSKLQPKDVILLTDVSGTVHYYEVVLLETLPGNATEEMITGGFDLSLYTCTPGGSNRVTVRCNAIQ